MGTGVHSKPAAQRLHPAVSPLNPSSQLNNNIQAVQKRRAEEVQLLLGRYRMTQLNQVSKTMNCIKDGMMCVTIYKHRSTGFFIHSRSRFWYSVARACLFVEIGLNHERKLRRQHAEVFRFTTFESCCQALKAGCSNVCHKVLMTRGLHTFHGRQLQCYAYNMEQPTSGLFFKADPFNSLSWRVESGPARCY